MIKDCISFVIVVGCSRINCLGVDDSIISWVDTRTIEKIERLLLISGLKYVSTDEHGHTGLKCQTMVYMYSMKELDKYIDTLKIYYDVNDVKYDRYKVEEFFDEYK